MSITEAECIPIKDGIPMAWRGAYINFKQKGTPKDDVTINEQL